jgi:hypothetical protein
MAVKTRKVGLPKGGSTNEVLKKTSGADYDTEWGTGGGGGGTPGGSDTQVQFNDAGSFGGDAGMTYNKTTDVLTVVGINLSGEIASRIVATDGSKNLDTPYTFVDEDDMASNSATALPSQQSVKAYVDNLTLADSDFLEMAYITSNFNYTQR